MSRRTSMIVTIGLVALLAAPLAFAGTRDPLREGIRNPVSGDATQETQIIARTGKDTYGTRQSNLGAGGGAIYGCRSTLDASGIGDPKKSTPCVRVNNLSSGKAFDFQARTSRIIGIFQAGNSITSPRPDAAPFVTNATATAVGLNADRVDSLHANELDHAGRQRGRRGDRWRRRGRRGRRGWRRRLPGEHDARRRRLHRERAARGAELRRRRGGVRVGRPPARAARRPARRAHAGPGQPRLGRDEREHHGGDAGARAGLRDRLGRRRDRRRDARQHVAVSLHHRLTRTTNGAALL